ncbi:MAG: carcinine hydrolase/isopenicillin-N N-acyltransferase family protein [Alistipes sp.]
MATVSFYHNSDSTPITRRAAYITDAEKLAMLDSIKDLDGQGRLYEVDYTIDYKLDEVLKSGITETTRLFGYVASLLYDKLPTDIGNVSFGAGCSAFAVPQSDGSDFLMGRNYDFRHFTDDNESYKPISAILVHTAPEGGKRSISMVDGLQLNYGQGFYSDENIDLSLLMGLPYAALDGINEDGFAIGVLALNEKQTCQNTGKPKINTTVAIRMLLDRASTVKEAIQMLKEYDMDMRGNGRSNYHYFMADATGDYAIVEYTFADGDEYPSIMEVFTGKDILRCVTNFYIAPSMANTTDGWCSSHGKDRYETMRKTLLDKKYALTAKEAMELLSAVSQPPTEELTSQTQWSSMYNLTEKSLKLAILREYGKEYNFKVK